MWEYVKGSEADFEGAPEWAVYVETTGRTPNHIIWFSEGHRVGDRYTSNHDLTGVFELHSGDEETPIVIAERRKVDEGGWIQWSGGECPVSENILVDVMFDDGLKPDLGVKAGDYDWENKSKPNLIKYRVCESIQQSATPTEALIAERGTRYGEFKDGAAIMQQLKDVMHAAPKWDALKPSQKEALEMIQHKIGRILNGDPDYDDNWKDIAGYATLIVKEIEG